MILLHNHIRALNNGSVIGFELQLDNCSSLGDDALRESKLCGLIPRFSSAWELETISAIGSKWHVVHAICTYSKGAVASLGRPLDPPLKVILGALSREEVTLESSIIQWTVDSVFLALGLWDVVKRSRFRLQKFNDGTFFHKECYLSIDVGLIDIIEVIFA